MTRQLTTAALAAKAIRKELKEKFPGVKFSVRSDNFAGGNAVDVRYDVITHGVEGDNKAPVSNVWSLISKYQYGHFDCMTDCYEYSNRRDDIPQAKYVHVSHKWS